MRTLVHSCFNPATEQKPDMCGCQHRITKAERDELLRRGAAASLESVGLSREIVMLPGEESKHTVAHTITETDIESAYVAQNRRAQHRIELYGRTGNFARTN